MSGAGLSEKRAPILRWAVEYRAFLQTVRHEFPNRARAVQWCQQIGRPDLIERIVAVRRKVTP